MLNARWNNPHITDDEVAVVERINTEIINHRGETGGWCGLACLILLGVLGNEDYEIMDGKGHWWVRNKRTGARLDPTADQFEGYDYDDEADKSTPVSGEERAQEWHYVRGISCEYDYVYQHYQWPWDEFGRPLVERMLSERVSTVRREAA